ncbi:ATP-binding protein [Actinomadura algeriensis]|uniref:Anti-sigma regulatory factor (Ser/Thr protein kinase) n=1 Tax=Actinomadura algeriensis TaxID=1679523 RepID=A0ABR9K273_9ACTN|nr:ATP-binding protein [Actinomadura algeriensis]MBE1536430.1 anti-sigma regulatory factor (Ser/Thr protein kinase) [Actinomadura algeriensis]
MDTSGDTTGTTDAQGPANEAAGRAAAWELPAWTGAAAAARALTIGALRDWRVADPGDADDIVLIVDELVTNAVLHGAGPIRLRLRLHGRRLVGEVADARPTGPPPAPADVPVWDEAGRGLLLIAALATEYGTAGGANGAAGKTVWFSRLLTPGDGHRPAAHHDDPR